MNMRINTQLKQNREYSRHGYVDEVRKKSRVGLVVRPEGMKLGAMQLFIRLSLLEEL
jgi:hypothetical protein